MTVVFDEEAVFDVDISVLVIGAGACGIVTWTVSKGQAQGIVCAGGKCLASVAVPLRALSRFCAVHSAHKRRGCGVAPIQCCRLHEAGKVTVTRSVAKGRKQFITQQ